MKIGRVIGTVVSTLKLDHYRGEKMLLVKLLNPDLSPASDYVVAFDRVMAGPGDRVLLVDEGNSARQILKTGPNGVVRAVCVGIIDAIDLAPAAPKAFGG